MSANRAQAASYSVLVDGAEIAPDQHDRVKEIRIVDYLRLPDVCSLQITYPKGDGVDTQPFQIGKPLEIRLGAADELLAHTLFRGEVLTIEPEFGAGGCSVRVRAFDRAHVLHRSRRVRTFQNQTTSDIVTKIVSEAGLIARCDVAGEPHEFIQQDNETDWDLIWRLADRAGLEFVVDGEIGELRRPTAASPVELEWPVTLRSFRPRVTGVQQVQEATVRAQDPLTGQVISARADRPEQIAQIGIQRSDVTGAFDDCTVHVATEPVASEAEGRALAQALLDRLANGYIAAEGVAPGNPMIRAGTAVQVSGVGTSFSGIYRVASSVHVLRSGSYETLFANSADHTVTGMLGAGGGARTAPAFGSQLVLGLVTNNDDPEGLGRVRVRYPALGDELEGAWARIASTSAGAERGLTMLPVVGEEVLIGFEHDDTRRPYVLGSLFNGADKPGDDLLQDHDGSFALRSDTKVHIDATGDVVLKSKANLVVEITGDAEETVGGARTFTTTGKTALKSDRAFELDGQSVAISGMSTVELKCGSSSIKLSSAGITLSGPTINLG
jgi:phage protein D/phage baseplate assembly protein gpV